MKNRIVHGVSRSIAVLLATILTVSLFPVSGYAANDDSDSRVVVSLGDSYSSGEGIEPFYSQEKPIYQKVNDDDWLAHRSTKSWPSLLKIPDLDGTMADYNVKTTNSSECQWYFAASSGATTKHMKNVQQKNIDRSDTNVVRVPLPAQLKVFDDISGTVDYVTLTIGGNDVDFANIITACATGSSYLNFNFFGKKLDERIAEVWANINTTKANIKQAYYDIQDAAGEQATIIVAGYPKLLDKDGKGALISKNEATTVNTNVTKFNNIIKELVTECSNAGMNIYYVDVESEFDRDGGHQAYSSDSWINKIILRKQREDLETSGVGSAYSVHPNEEGAKAYARCVNAKIAEIENNKKTGTLSGKICKASDRTTPVLDATISVVGENSTKSFAPDNNGNYSITMPEGEYLVKITAPGYIEFNAYATVTADENTYMETFLLVEGSEGESGIASGTINNALTGSGIEGVTLEVRNGWNNDENGDILTTITTDSSGNYNVTLPLGNYTLNASKDGYISTMINIIVQSGKTSSQNGTMTPIVSGDNFRIVLTWGANPRDLDSHMVGTLSGGSSFHVYYRHKSQYDGGVEVCNLDVDDTSSYGPETITLNTTVDTPYYYYIYRYAGSGTVASSEAQVKLYQGETLVATFNVPTDQGSGDYWNVFAIVNGELVIKNTITSNADTSYATTGIASQLADFSAEDMQPDKSIDAANAEIKENTASTIEETEKQDSTDTAIGDTESISETETTTSEMPDKPNRSLK